MDCVKFTFQNNEYFIYVGKTSKHNWEQIDASNYSDVWFHVSDKSSSHVILRNNITKLRDIPRQVIKRCAYLCRIHSSSKRDKNM